MESIQSVAASWQFTSLIKKAGCGTTEFSFDLVECEPGRCLSQHLFRNTIMVNIGEPLAISFWSNHQWQSFIANSGAMVCMLPAGSQVEMKWSQRLYVVMLSFDNSFIARTSGRSTDVPARWNASDTLVSTLAARIVPIAQSSYFAERIYAESLAVAMVEHACRQYRDGGHDTTKGRLSPHQLLHVLTFAYDYMHTDIGLVELAELVHLSPYHFGRLFKQTIGLSPYQYLLQLRIEFAKKLIAQGTGPLGEIAYRLNFSDQAHFSNAFRKATGISPRQYLQSHVPA